jgi:hypothetical protein
LLFLKQCAGAWCQTEEKMRKSVSRANAAAWSLGLRRPLRPAILRFASTADTSQKTHTGERPFWTTGRALLLSTLAGSIAYVFGVTNAGNLLEQPRPSDSRVPVYGTTKDLERVSHPRDLVTIEVLCRAPSRRDSL